MDSEFNFIVDVPGARLDSYLAARLSGISRTRVQKLIDDGLVTVNGHAARAGLKLAAGDNLRVSVPPVTPGTLAAEPIPLSILYEDEDLLVINKPAGLTVHPAPGHPEHTMVNALLSHFPRLAEMGDSLRPGIVHRLDRDTSGALVVAKNTPARLNLAEQFKARTVNKTYLVLVNGHLTPESGIIEAPIGRDPANRQRMAVVSGGRFARSDYRVVRYFKGQSLLEVKLHTGRTHQIRVHLKAIGFPVVGDKVYGIKSSQLSRQFLHAFRLGFHLPSSGEYHEFTAELPEDLKQALEALEE
jgi:23S rRNA pseudouridine1911/1915/1917 synthase